MHQVPAKAKRLINFSARPKAAVWEVLGLHVSSVVYLK